jgi:hypothetical protein
MASSRSVQQVRSELESEREGLTEDVEELREEGDRLKSKLPLIVGGTIAGLVALRVLRRVIGLRLLLKLAGR